MSRQYQFNVNAPIRGASMDSPSQDAIENTLNLRQVSLEDAARYGGSITRNALGLLNLHGDRKHVIVDTKVHFLMPGMCPSIPGWHTDGIPRGETLDPAGSGDPVLSAMLSGESPRYHLLVTGTHCPTRFMLSEFDPSEGELLEGGANRLYSNMSHIVDSWYAKKHSFRTMDTEDSVMYEWDWWNIHTAQTATARGWRYLIRVTETDHITPRTNPADFIRTQNNVYAPMDFGW